MKIQVILLSGAVLAAASLGAQTEMPHPYGGVHTHVAGVFITPVAGAPFTATVTIQTEAPLPDGATHTKYTVNVIARDSAGRIHNERRRLVSSSFRGTPPLIEVHVFDPLTRMSTFYNPITLVATERILPAPPAEASHIRPGASVQDLGTSQLDGLQTRGMRTTYTVPAQFSGTGKPIQVTDEYWYSDDLHMTVMIRHNDPRTGVQTVALTSVNRQEPAPNWFQVPDGYKVVDVTPPALERGPTAAPANR